MTAVVILHPALRERLGLERRIGEKAAELAEWDDLCDSVGKGLIRCPDWWAGEEPITCPDPQQALYEVVCAERDEVAAELAALEAQASNGTAAGVRPGTGE